MIQDPPRPRSVRLPLPRRRRLNRRRMSAARRIRIVLGLAAAAILAVGAWLWLRDSSLVSVQRVTITGVSGTEAPRIRAALTGAARTMTTLNVRESTLRAAVSPYPVVKSLRVSSHFPHGLTIDVTEQLPVAVVMVGDRPLPVAADGTVLHDVTPTGALPTIAVKAAPGGSTITDPTARLELAVLAGAPSQLLGRLTAVSTSYWHGVQVTVHQGPTLYFGDGGSISAKWQAVLSVLAAPATAGASYIDVSDPQRPAAGPSASAAANAASGSSTGTQTATGTSGATALGTGGTADATTGVGTASTGTG